MTDRTLKNHILGLTIMLSVFLQAAVALAASEAVPAPAGDQWYFYLASGISRPVYDPDFQRDIDAQKAQGGSSQYAATFDMPAVYHRLGSGFLLGLAFNGVLETYARKWQEQNSLSFDVYNLNLSANYFISEHVGTGWFARLDIGDSRLVRVVEHPNYARANFNDTFYQLGGGYGIVATQYADLLLQLNYFYADYREHFIHGPALSVGFLL